MSLSFGWTGPFVKTLGTTGCAPDSGFFNACIKLLCDQVGDPSQAQAFQDETGSNIATFLALCARSCSFGESLSNTFSSTNDPRVYEKCNTTGTQIALFITGMLTAIMAICCGINYCSKRSAYNSAVHQAVTGLRLPDHIPENFTAEGTVVPLNDTAAVPAPV